MRARSKAGSEYCRARKRSRRYVPWLWRYRPISPTQPPKTQNPTSTTSTPNQNHPDLTKTHPGLQWGPPDRMGEEREGKTGLGEQEGVRGELSKRLGMGKRAVLRLQGQRDEPFRVDSGQGEDSLGVALPEQQRGLGREARRRCDLRSSVRATLGRRVWCPCRTRRRNWGQRRS